ncbi:MAG: hypothetical protein NTU62_13380 [Spirochaetes bacterium]|nr:hypothetical protein [Spirochaetota bacterium]
MSQRVVTSGAGQGDLLTAIRDDLRAARPRAVGIASAYVTVSGVEAIIPVLRRAKVAVCRLVAGIDDHITHPEALRRGIAFGWEVRMARSPQGRFHPKLIVGGARFDADDAMLDPVFLYLGSGNLTGPGLQVNTESAVVARDDGLIAGAPEAFATFWRLAEPATPDAIKQYSALFAERSRQRRPEVLEALGVSESRRVAEASSAKLRAQPRPRITTVSQLFATTAWTGLESFTGEYAFQVEFPRAAGEVVARLARAGRQKTVDVQCEDTNVRKMTFRFYRDNGMFRLNVPNNVPGVDWARLNHDGVAVVSRGPEGGASLRLQILRPGPKVDDLLARSYALSSWGRTSTRVYGWF